MDNNNDNNKLDKISEDIVDIKVTMAKNTSSLEEHIKRTSIAENRLDNLENRIVEELKPIHKHIAFVKGAIWMIGICAMLIFGLQQIGILQKLFN